MAGLAIGVAGVIEIEDIPIGGIDMALIAGTFSVVPVWFFFLMAGQALLDIFVSVFNLVP
jgi:hypothetical protein